MPEAIQNVWQRIYSEFLPQGIYSHAGTPDLEVYFEGDNSASDYRCEVWIPVVKKQDAIIGKGAVKKQTE